MIGNAIKFIRIRKNISQIELSEMIQTSYSFISLIERNKRNPSFQTLQKIAIALDKPLFLICFLAENNEDNTMMETISLELKEKLAYEAIK